MECTITSGRRNKRARSALTLVEVMVAMTLGTMTIGAVMSFSIFGARSFVAMGNYVDLDRKSRNTLDTMSKDIRQAVKCATNGFSTTNLALQMADPTSGQSYTLTYNYNPDGQKLKRTYSDA